ncbi:MarR family winged helix-turn-helix transcriptional regulator [Roseateles sp. L2-2]|uniref:MarR family winged helix-turn-helix transcriptional regulator n=1 Tax=Roseateles TaxID=93681 RepID=UPI003D35D316
MSTNTTGRRGKDEDVLELVHSVMHRYRSLQYRFLRDGPQDITHMEGKVLFFFDRHPDATQSDLAQHSGRDKAQLARLIKTLRDKGLLDAKTDEADRRQVRLSVSEAGMTVQRELKRQAKQVSVQALAGLSAEEQAQLAALLKRVQANLGEE